eukprot:Em0020g772a
MIGSVGSCGGYLTAANRDPGQGLPCSTSTLTISAHTVLNGLHIECRDMSQEEFGILVGNTSIIIVGPPGDPTITAVAVTTEDMAVTWITPTADGNPTSYNISITNRSDPVKIQNPAFYFTNYTVYLASINGYGDIGPENNVTISDFGTSVETTAVTGTIEKMFHTTYYLYPTSPVISNKDVIYEDLSRGKCNPDAHGVVTMTNIAYAARSDMAYNVQQS